MAHTQKARVVRTRTARSELIYQESRVRARLADVADKHLASMSFCTKLYTYFRQMEETNNELKSRQHYIKKLLVFTPSSPTILIIISCSRCLVSIR